jgi:hypothetical protein
MSSSTDTFDTFISILSKNEDETDSTMTELESSRDNIEKIKNIVGEVNTMIGNLKKQMKVEVSTDKFSSFSLNEDNKTKVSSLFQTTQPSSRTLDSLIDKIQTVKDKEIFGLVVDMLYDSVINSYTE